MDLTFLTDEITTVVVSLFGKVTKDMAKGAKDKLLSLYDSLKEKYFKSDEHKKVIEDLEKDADNEEEIGKFKGKFSEIMKNENDEVISKMLKLIEEIKTNNTDFNTVFNNNIQSIKSIIQIGVVNGGLTIGNM